MKKLLAEAFGSFMMLLIGTGSVMLDAVGVPVGNAGISFAFGGTVCVMIILFYKLSGAHFNPVVSVVACIRKKITQKELALYVVFQLIGGALASFILLGFFGDTAQLGMTLPKAGIGTSFALEVVFTFALMFLILITDFSTTKNAVVSAALIGAMIFVEAFFGGAYTGASMNPMRSLAPAIAAGQLGTVWLYIAAPLVGGLLAYGLHRMLPQKQAANVQLESIAKGGH